MKTFDVYGFLVEMEEARPVVENALHVALVAHESSYHCGEYYRHADGGQESLILQKNFDVTDNEWTEAEHKAYPTVLYVSESPRADLIRDRLLSEANAILLRREQL